MGTERPWQPHCCAGESKAQGRPCSTRWERAVGVGGGVGSSKESNQEPKGGVLEHVCAELV